MELLENVGFVDLCRNWGALEPVYVRGQANIMLGRGEDAATDFELILSHPEIVRNDAKGSLAHLWLARAALVSGDTTKARQQYERFLGLWKDADPDVPILREAKLEYENLQLRNASKITSQ